MIVKEFDGVNPPRDPRLRAGFDAEKQMAFYLHRAFATDAKVCVLNGVRILDTAQPDPDGKPAAAQIDHLVLHPHGAIIIESKSVSGRVRVRDDGHGADEWQRDFQGKREGIPSPLRQAGRQADFLRNYLQRHREQLRERATGLQAAALKALQMSAQFGFAHMPIQLFVAISDNGILDREGGWKEPSNPFQTWVGKADNVADMVRKEVTRHGGATTLANMVIRGKQDGDYGIWGMNAAELSRTAEFLKESHRPLHAGSNTAVGATSAQDSSIRSPARVEDSPVPPPLPRRLEARGAAGGSASNVAAGGTGNLCGASCKGCGGAVLSAQWGKFGYYWRCADCGVNTAMPTVCSVCGVKGARGDGVKIRKEGPRYYRRCEGCGIDECIWIEGVK